MTALILLGVNTVVLTLLVCVLAVPKLLVREGVHRDRIRHLLARLGETWIAVNNAFLGRYAHTEWDLELPGGLDPQGCYLVTANHQSWVDIPVLQRCFNRRLPLLRFFIKSQLIWVPFLGPAWWALDFPFMKRLSREQLARRPEMRGRDLESARQACEKFRRIPVAMMNVPEGTRFNDPKRQRSGGAYRNLLPPRTGGIGQVLHALSDELDGWVDVTVFYQRRDGVETAPTLWQLVSGQVERIVVRATCRGIPETLAGRDFRSSDANRRELQRQVESLWREKDDRLEALRIQARRASH